jgi:hypothetical protein
MMTEVEVWLRAWEAAMLSPQNIKGTCADVADRILAGSKERFPNAFAESPAEKPATVTAKRMYAAMREAVDSSENIGKDRCWVCAEEAMRLLGGKT